MTRFIFAVLAGILIIVGIQKLLRASRQSQQDVAEYSQPSTEPQTVVNEDVAVPQKHADNFQRATLPAAPAVVQAPPVQTALSEQVPKDGKNSEMTAPMFGSKNSQENILKSLGLNDEQVEAVRQINQGQVVAINQALSNGPATRQVLSQISNQYQAAMAQVMGPEAFAAYQEKMSQFIEQLPERPGLSQRAPTALPIADAALNAVP